MNFIKSTKNSAVQATATHASAKRRHLGTLGLLLGTTCALLVTMGALNGGVAVSTSTWDAIKNYLSSMLSSSFVLSLALVSLLVCVWQIAHGRGYGHVGTVLAVLALSLLGPGMVTAAATATRSPQAVIAPADVTAPGHGVAAAHAAAISLKQLAGARLA